MRMMLLLQGPIPPHAPRDNTLAGCMVVLLAVLLLGVVYLVGVIRRIRETEAAYKLADELWREDERRRRSDPPWSENDA